MLENFDASSCRPDFEQTVRRIFSRKVQIIVLSNITSEGKRLLIEDVMEVWWKVPSEVIIPFYEENIAAISDEELSPETKTAMRETIKLTLESLDKGWIQEKTHEPT